MPGAVLCVHMEHKTCCTMYTQFMINRKLLKKILYTSVPFVMPTKKGNEENLEWKAALLETHSF